MKNIFKFSLDKFRLLTVVGITLLFIQNNSSNLLVKAETTEVTVLFVEKVIYDTLTPKVWQRIEEIVPPEKQYMWPDDDDEVVITYSNKTVIELGVNDKY